ncbi:hypothetical protein [Paraliomyxa miuraensis]|uniref:hypothetical protein n=1 Tax=Paraliomyxa miuraensis TaxID=376150 RepID=UPI0022510710|nr:hypothetical protein [Paraliomyxa miuraensis]MCX4242272.1 hypothetical protein [Paraliomyxa miuraensis]
MTSFHDRSSGALPLRTSRWFAWVDRMPPWPGALHVTGVVVMSSAGYDVRLVPSPQQRDPDVLVLELEITERPGSWPREVTPITVRYDGRPEAGTYEKVVVRLPSGQEIPLPFDETF